MTKRTSYQYPARDRDFWPTPPEALESLLPHLTDVTAFYEPMCGDGAIVRGLENLGVPCAGCSDIQPEGPLKAWAEKLDVFYVNRRRAQRSSHFISNPPWPARHQRGRPTTLIAHHLRKILPTWLILSADFAHNVYAPPLLEHCPKIVSAGRVKWIPDSQGSGYDNACWYLFTAEKAPKTVFYGHNA